MNTAQQTYEEMFDEDLEYKPEFTPEQIRKITIDAYIDRDKEFNCLDDASHQYEMITKLMNHNYITKKSIRFTILFRASNAKDLYDALSLRELECLGY
jgi:hypothetical protein